MGFDDVQITVSGDFVNVEVTEGALLIGKSGRNLSALQFLIKRALQKELDEFPQFTLDVNNYRQEKVKIIKEQAQEAAQEVELNKKEVCLPVMSPYKRRIVHLELSDNPNVETRSRGEEPKRGVVVRPVE